MDVQSGQKSNAKVIQYSLREGDDNYYLIELSQRHRQALLASCAYLRWMSRHASLPDDLITNDALDAWVSDLELRLMTNIDICAKMIECLETDEDVKSAFEDFIRDRYGLEPATEKTRQELTENLDAGNNPTCDYDLLFARCRAVIDYTHLAVLDVTQKLEVITNAIELAKAAFDTIPGVSVIDDLTGINGAIQLVEYYQEAIQEGYEAQYTETPLGVRDQLSYALFCLCKADCKISIDRIIKMYQKRLSIYTAPPSLDGLINFLSQIAGTEPDSTFIVEMSHYVAWGLVKLASILFGGIFDTDALKFILALTDEGDNDWMDFEPEFGECPEEVLLTPILKIVSDFYPAPKGYDLLPVEGEPGFWIVNSSLLEGGGYGIVIEEENGEPFSISGRTFPDGLTSANYNAVIDGVDTALFFSSPQHDNMSEVFLAMFAGTPNARFKFKFFRPA